VEPHPAPQPPVFLNAGCGAGGRNAVPAYFHAWRQIRVDLNPDVAPDLVASVTDLAAIPDGSMDAVWSAHCLEHLFAHQVPVALGEFHRVLNPTGFACIIVPDVQAIAGWIAEDRLHETVYESPAGPVTAHDILWGHGPAVARGDTAMAHRCGFTPTLFLERLNAAHFAEIVLRRRSNLELAGLALRQATGGTARREFLLAELNL
jgi:SAM-dependent methyltransferase